MTTLAGASCTHAADWDPYTAPGPPDLASLSQCGEPAIALATLICAHEHADKALLCAGCAADLQRMAPDLTCGRCEDLCEGAGAGPHECRQALRIEWFSGEVTDA